MSCLILLPRFGSNRQEHSLPAKAKPRRGVAWVRLRRGSLGGAYEGKSTFSLELITCQSREREGPICRIGTGRRVVTAR